MRTPEEAKELPRRFYDEVFNKRNLTFAEEAISDSVVEHNPVDPRMGNDRSAAIASIQAILDNSPDIKVEMLDMIATGDRVAMRARFSGTDSGKGWGAPMGAPATGKSFSVVGIDVVRIDEDGRFIEHYGLFDVPSMMVQLGLMPAPGGDR
jgi:predicted ester cyclase